MQMGLYSVMAVTGGQAGIIFSGQASTAQGDYRAVALAFPPTALTCRVANPRSFYALRDDSASPRWKLLDGFLTQYTESRHVWSDSEFETLTQQLLDLIVMLIVEPCQQPSAAEGACRVAHRSRALRHIRARLPDRDLPFMRNYRILYRS